uniref:Uncharacterized protein n=1 Tax=Triticum urartu TaxID=4572 RepID=A0A8R7R4C9_TRIUA
MPSSSTYLFPSTFEHTGGARFRGRTTMVRDRRQNHSFSPHL